LPTGIVNRITPKETAAGKKYLTIEIDGTWGSYWGPEDFVAGDTVEYTATQKGQYTNYSDVRKTAGSHGAASPRRGTTVRGDKETAITRMACTRTAVQLMTPFAPGKKETPGDRLLAVLVLAEELEKYVYGQPINLKTPPASLPEVERPDDSVFPKE